MGVFRLLKSTQPSAKRSLRMFIWKSLSFHRHFSAAGSFQAAYDEPLKQGVTSATAEKDHYAEKGENREHPRGVDDPAPNRVAPPSVSVHFATSPRDFSR